MEVTYSDYLRSRRFNQKLFDKVKAAITQLDFRATAQFDMSAKYQTPTIYVHGTQRVEAADEIHNILDEYFSTTEPRHISDTKIEVSFED